MNLQKLEKEVPFDQFSRQYQVKKILESLEGANQYTVLDVGGYKGRTAEFLTDAKVTVVDLYDVEEKNYVKGSGTDLPFEPESFDYVTSFDVLEHIPSKQREKFIAECARVAKKGVIVCAPAKSSENELAEKKLNKLYERLHKEPHPWLREHIENGIPDFSLTEASVKKHGFHTVRFYSNKNSLWMAMQQAIFINSKFPLASEALTKLNRYYNKNFLYDGGSLDATAYRQILCGLKNSKDIHKLQTALGNINKPIEPLLELELADQVHGYYHVLIEKTAQLAEDYKGLFDYNKQRADTYEEQNNKLRQQIAHTEARPVASAASNLRKKLKRRLG